MILGDDLFGGPSETQTAGRQRSDDYRIAHYPDIELDIRTWRDLLEAIRIDGEPVRETSS